MSKDQNKNEPPLWRQHQRPRTCWLLADNQLAFAKKPTEQNKKLFKSLLKHALIFNVAQQKLVFSDSQVINNTTFRMLLREDADFQQLMSSQIIELAVRDEGDGSQFHDLQDMVSGFIKEEKYFFDAAHYGEGNELKFLARNLVPFVSYKLGDISKRYEREALNLFKGPRAQNELGIELAAQIYDLGREEADRIRGVRSKGGEGPSALGWKFFHTELQTKLREHDWKQYGEAISKFAQLPFHSGLPDVLGADAIYANEHASAFDLVRGIRKGEVLESVKESFDGILGLAEYVDGLELLTVEDIYDLLDSDEAENYGEKREALNGSREASKDLQTAIRSYARVVEEKIIFRDSSLRHSSNTHSSQQIEIRHENFTRNMLDGTKTFLEFAGILSQWMGVLSCAFNRIVYDPQEKHHQKSVFEKEREKVARLDIEAAELKKEWDADSPLKIKHDTILRSEDNDQAMMEIHYRK